jgi:hypothetical protein
LANNSREKIKIRGKKCSQRRGEGYLSPQRGGDCSGFFLVKEQAAKEINGIY